MNMGLTNNLTQNSFSYFDNIRSNKKLKDITIQDLYSIVTDPQYKDIISDIRALQGDKSKKDSLKQKLPYFVASGVYDNRNDSSLKTPSDYICIDFDHIVKGNDTNNEESWRNHFTARLPNLGARLIFKSPSGDGFKVIFEVVHGSFTNKESYKNTFLKLTLSINTLFNEHNEDFPYSWLIGKGVESGIDMKTAISQPCFISYDPDAVLCDWCMPFDPDFVSDDEVNDYLVYTNGTPQQNKVPSECVDIVTSGTDEVAFYTRKVVESGVDITANYDDWVTLGYMYNNYQNGRSLYQEIGSRYNAAIDTDKECSKQFDACAKGKLKPDIRFLMNLMNRKYSLPVSEWAKEYYQIRKAKKRNYTKGTQEDAEKHKANSGTIAKEDNKVSNIIQEAFAQSFSAEWYQRKRKERSEGIEIGYTISQKSLVDGTYIDVPIKLPHQGFGMIAGSLGHGKTSVICNIVLNIAEKYPDKKVALLVYEEDEFDIHIRLANIMLGTYYTKADEITNNDLIASYLSGDEVRGTKDDDEFYKRLDHFKELINTHRIVIINKGELSQIDNITSAIKEAKEKHPELCAVFIDHIQLLQGEKRKERYEEVGEIANELERLSINDVHIPIMVASQFNRGAKNVETMSDSNISTSYAISQSSNLTLGVFNSEAKNEDRERDDTDDIKHGWQYDSNNKTDGKTKIALKVLKCRNGYLRRNTIAVLDVDKASQKMTNAKEEEREF